MICAGSSMQSVEIRQLTPLDDRSGFSSGHAALDQFFRKYAGQNQFRLRIGTTYIAVAEGRIVGYATVSAGAIEPARISSLVRGLPSYQAPVLRLARMEVAQSAQGSGLGKDLLRFACRLAVQMSTDLGCVGLIVDAKPEAIGFYERFGFHPLMTEPDIEPSAPRPLFLPVGTILRAMGSERA
jgi:GNAT superfamily N-acetyltransferase